MTGGGPMPDDADLIDPDELLPDDDDAGQDPPDDDGTDDE